MCFVQYNLQTMGGKINIMTNIVVTLSSHNAETGQQRTTYNFDITDTKLQEALDIWAQFFINPLMAENTVEREMLAVNSEFENAKKDDGIRLTHVLKDAIVKTNHPMANFDCGNIETLKNNLEKDGVTAFQLLHEWYPKHYSSKWMYLTLQSGVGPKYFIDLLL